MGRMIKRLPMVSIIIDSYNFAHFLDDAIESALNQTAFGADIEIIFVDDGSTDNTRDKIRKYKDKIKYIYKENGGQASALNAGFEVSKGEIISLLDSDDIFYPDKIKRIVEIYEKYKCQAIFNSLIEFGEGIIHRKSLADYNLQFLSEVDNNIYRLNYKDNKSSFLFLAQTSGQSFTRELYKKLHPIPELYRFSADLYLHVFALLYGDIYYADEPMTKYRQHPYSYMGRNFEGDINHKISEIDFLLHTINILKKSDNSRALPLIDSLQNKIHYLSFKLFKFKGDKIDALRHLLKYKTSPRTFNERTVTKARYICDLVIPENLYKPLKKLYRGIR